MHPILVTGATGRVGRLVVDRLVDAGVPVRALTRRPAAASLPAAVEVVAGDLTAPESLNAALTGVGAVFLVWTAAPTTVAAVIARLATHAQRIVFLSSPHRTPHPFFQQPNPMAALHADIERAIGATGLASTIIRPGMFASTRYPGGAPQFETGTSCGGRTPRPRRHRSTSATSRPWRRERSMRTGMPEPITSSRAPSR